MFSITPAFYPMEKLGCYVLQANFTLHKQLPKIIFVCAALASNYMSIMTYDSIYEIGNILLSQRKSKKVGDDVDIEGKYSNGDDCDFIQDKDRSCSNDDMLTCHHLMTSLTMMTKG